MASLELNMSSEDKFNKNEMTKKFRNFTSEQIESILNGLNKKVSIIIPIYNAHQETKACIKSILDHTRIDYELLLIDDCSTDKRIKRILNKIEKKPFVKVIRNKNNKGFVESVNIGIKDTQGDVILLNSDTIVTDRWIQKLIIAAYSNRNIGTVTPFSNAAGAFSVPKIGRNEIPNHLTISSMAKLVERVSKKIYPEVPTGNGFCMYIKRQTIEKVGLFDAENFNKGYGEENDFCMRAGYRGWKNIVDDSTFIYHKRTASFSFEEKENLLKKHRAIIDKLYPEYTREVRKFIKSSKFENIRKEIEKEINNPTKEVIKDKKRILFVLHDGNGGTPETNKDLMRNIEKMYECFLLISNKKEITLLKYNYGNLDRVFCWRLVENWKMHKFYNKEFQNIYFNILVNLKIDIVHIRHLLYHSFDLPRVAKILGLPVILSFHDFYYVCPTIHLVGDQNVYCGLNCTEENRKCQIPIWRGNISDVRKWISTWRSAVSDMLKYCTGFVTTSELAKSIYLQVYPDIKNSDFRIIEHGRDFPARNDKDRLSMNPKKTKPIKILIPGNIGIHKGAKLIEDLKSLDTDEKLEFHFLGNLCNVIKGKGIGIEHGSYKREEFHEKVKEIKPSFIGIFSVFPETYCHVLTEAWNCGIPVVASKIGALEERISKCGGGWLIDFTDPASTFKKIIKISNDIEEYQKVKNEIKNIKIRSTKDMSIEYEKMYLDVLSKRFDDNKRISKL